MTFAGSFEELLRSFKQHDVDYMVVGAYALNFHGYNRSTGDLDIWTKPTLENQNKIYRVLNSMGFAADAVEEFLSLDFNKPFLFSIGDNPYYVDIMNSVAGVKYEEAETRMIKFEFAEGLVVNFIDWRDLVVNKMLTGRDKDKADVEELQKIIRLKGKDK